MTLSDIEDVLVARISATPPDRKVTWNDVVAMSVELGVPCTRQWLHANNAIASAYRGRRSLRRSETSGTLDGTAVDPLLSLKLKVAELSAALRAYDERFVRYVYNAQRSGLTIIDLDRPMPARQASGSRRKG